MMNLVAGNFDSEFVDNPDIFDIERTARGHLAFGYGVHQCIGQNLARLELQIALTTVARRLPGLRLAAPVEGLELHERSSDLPHGGVAAHLVTVEQRLRRCDPTAVY